MSSSSSYNGGNHTLFDPNDVNLRGSPVAVRLTEDGLKHHTEKELLSLQKKTVSPSHRARLQQQELQDLQELQELQLQERQQQYRCKQHPSMTIEEWKHQRELEQWKMKHRQASENSNSVHNNNNNNNNNNNSSHHRRSSRHEHEAATSTTSISPRSERRMKHIAKIESKLQRQQQKYPMTVSPTNSINLGSPARSPKSVQSCNSGSANNDLDYNNNNYNERASPTNKSRRFMAMFRRGSGPHRSSEQHKLDTSPTRRNNNDCNDCNKKKNKNHPKKQQRQLSPSAGWNNHRQQQQQQQQHPSSPASTIANVIPLEQFMEYHGTSSPKHSAGNGNLDHSPSSQTDLVLSMQVLSSPSPPTSKRNNNNTNSSNNNRRHSVPDSNSPMIVPLEKFLELQGSLPELHDKKSRSNHLYHDISSNSNNNNNNTSSFSNRLEDVSLAPLNEIEMHITQEEELTLATSNAQQGTLSPYALQFHARKQEWLLGQRERERQAKLEKLQKERQEKLRTERLRNEYLQRQREMRQEELQKYHRSVAAAAAAANERPTATTPRVTLSTEDGSNNFGQTFTSEGSITAAATTTTTTTTGPCVICNVKERTHIATPCMHFSFCQDCVHKIQDKHNYNNNMFPAYDVNGLKCPVCSTAHVAFARVNVSV